MNRWRCSIFGSISRSASFSWANETILADSTALPAIGRNVVKDGEYLACPLIAVVEKELGLGVFGVPIKHGALLRIPAAGLVEHAQRVIVACVEEADIRR